MVKIFRTKRKFNDREKLNVIFMTFKSLTDFTCKRTPYS